MLNSKKLFRHRIIGVIGDVNTGKSMLIYNIINSVPDHVKIYTYGLRIDKGIKIYSVNELEQIQNSIIIIDELSSFFDLDNRKNKKIIEITLRLIHHNNNYLILAGVPENFKKFISAKINTFCFKKISKDDLINGSTAKKIIDNYKGVENGQSILNIPVTEYLLYDGLHFFKEKIKYFTKYDSKKDNINLFDF